MATQVTKLIITCSDEIWLSFENEICVGFSTYSYRQDYPIEKVDARCITTYAVSVFI